MPTQTELLPQNIKKLNDKIIQMKSKSTLAPPVPKLEIDNMIMTKRQISKRRLLMAGGIISASGQLINATNTASSATISNLNDLGADIDTSGTDDALANKEVQFAQNASQMIGQKMTPEAAHYIVYGKFKRGPNGELIDNEIEDPDCVNTSTGMPDTHPTFEDIQLTTNRALKALKMLGLRQQELIEDTAQYLISLPATVMAISSAAAIMPFGAGVPTAFAVFQTFVQNTMNLVSKIGNFAIDIEYLNPLPILIAAEKIDAVIGVINAQLNLIYTLLSVFDNLTATMPSVPSPPGQNNTPADPINVDITMTPSPAQMLKDVKITTSVTGGSWEYKYEWKTNDVNNTVLSNKKELTLKKVVQNVDIKLTVTDSKGSKSEKIIPIIIAL